MPISLEQWRVAIGRGLPAFNGHWSSGEEWSGHRLVRREHLLRQVNATAGKRKSMDWKREKQHKDGTFDLVVTTEEFVMTSGWNECRDGSVRNTAGALLELSECTWLVALLFLMILLRSGDVETNPGPVEGGRWLCLLESLHELWDTFGE